MVFFLIYIFSDRDIVREQKLYSAASDGNVDVVKELIKFTFIDPTHPENLYFTPLMEAGKFLILLLQWVLDYRGLYYHNPCNAGIDKNSMSSITAIFFY